MTLCEAGDLRSALESMWAGAVSGCQMWIFYKLTVRLSIYCALLCTWTYFQKITSLNVVLSKLGVLNMYKALGLMPSMK